VGSQAGDPDTEDLEVMYSLSLPTSFILFSCLAQLCQAVVIPILSTIPNLFLRSQSTQTLLSTQWENPSDSLSVLLVIGGDIIQKALAQFSGCRLVPVAFSFGWVAYSFSTLVSVVGSGRLMPTPDYPAKVINAENGYTRENKSWILGRLLRDFEYPLPDNIGLSITIFEASEEGGKEAGVPSVDWYWRSGLIVLVVQLGIAAIPCGLYNDWGILLVTSAGIILALATGALPQWKFEKWACRRKTKKVVSLTGGNGTRHVMVIIGKRKGLDLEDLAAAESPRMRRRGEERSPLVIRDMLAAFWITEVACLILASLWTVFLLTVAGLKQNAWYLLTVGELGMIQNVIVAGARREESTYGIHLEKIETIERQKVMDALMDLETAYKTVGRSLVPIFFSDINSLRSAETRWWNGDKEAYDGLRKSDRPRSLQAPPAPGSRPFEAREKHSL